MSGEAEPHSMRVEDHYWAIPAAAHLAASDRTRPNKGEEWRDLRRTGP